MLPRVRQKLLPPKALWLAWCLVLTTGCSLLTPKFEKPVVSVVSIQMVGGNLLQQNFLLTLNIQNPNDRALPVTSLHADLSVMGDSVASGLSNRSVVVPAHGDAQFDLSIKANMALVLLKLAGRTDKRSDLVDYQLTGAASIDLPFMRDLPFHQAGSFSPSAALSR
jgi:LEA14-like dessication related protein